MYVSIAEIDLVEILNLDKSMSIGEIDVILEHLSKETYFRFLFEELPLLINKTDYLKISEKYKNGSDIDELMNDLDSQYPSLNFQFKLQQISNVIKREFIINYLKELKKDYDNKVIKNNADLILEEVLKDQINLDKCLTYKENLLKEINKINK